MKIIDINDSGRECQSVGPDHEYPGFMKVQYKRHFEWMTIEEFLGKNPQLKKLADTAHHFAPDIACVVTSSGDNFLKDSTQNWQKNCYAGYSVWISRGKGEGQKRTIIKNEVNTLHIDQNWDIKPNQTSQYVVAQNLQDVKAMGNTLPVEDMKLQEKRAEKIRRSREIKPRPYQYNPKKKKKLPF